MPDLKLDPTSGDLYQAPSGDLALTDDASGETILQWVRMALKSLAGEWFMDTRRGIDYPGIVWVKNPDFATVSAAFKDAILAVPGVASIPTFDLAWSDRAARKLAVTGTIQDVAGNTIPLDEVI